MPGGDSNQSFPLTHSYPDLQFLCLFKTFSYMAYKRRTRKAQGVDGTVIRPMDLAEYTQKYIYADIYQKDVKWPLLRAIAFLAISFALAFVA